MKRIGLWAFAALALHAVHAAAQNAAATGPKPIVRVELEPKEVTVGSAIQMRVIVLSPTWFPKPPSYPDFEIADAITRLPPNSSFNISEEVDGETWQGTARDYAIYPQRAADFELGDAQILVTYADPETRKPVEAKVPVPKITFSGTVPAGAERLDPFLAAESLTFKATIDGLADPPVPGNAFTRIVEVSATGLPGMLIPPLIGLDAPAGLGAYPEQPVVDDKPGNRGGPSTGHRREKVSYVVERPGDYVLPAIELKWWNAQTKKIETARAEPVVLSVPVPDGWQEASGSTQETAAGRGWIAAIAVLAAVLAAIFVLNRRLRQRIAESLATRRARRAASEPVRYRHLQHAVDAEGPAEIQAALQRWRASLPLQWDRVDTSGLAAAVTRFQRAHYGPDGGGAADSQLRGGLSGEIRALRKTIRGIADRERKPQLPPLNPTSPLQPS